MELKLVTAQQITLGLNQEALDEWAEYRKEKGKPLSALALKKTMNVMLKHDEAQQQRMVDAAIMNDWQGLHEIDAPKQRSTRSITLEESLTDTSWAN